jgi:glucosamine 6-phosphate synthetase-like amidotransferase/phosphosugar isomerase protein
MCGIVGFAVKYKNGFTKATEDCFFDMLFADTLRGDDSTGIIYVENDASFGIMKEATSGSWFAPSAAQDPTLKGMFQRGKAYIGHNRAATKGAITDENAHPFVVDKNFAMVHNGTLYSHKDLADTTVDSEALAIHLSKVLVKDFDKEKFEEAMGKVNGAFAIVAYNQEANQIYLTRNSQRPLCLMEVEEGWMWASEGLLLPWVANRNSISTQGKTLVPIKEHQLVTIDLGTNKVTMEDYVPKKATPPVMDKTGGKAKAMHTPTPVHGTSTEITKYSGFGKVSKNEFKRLRKRHLQSVVTFYVDDYLEKHFPLTIADGETDIVLLGQCDSFDFQHTISAEFDLNDCTPTDCTVTDKLYTGRITDMSYTGGKGWVSISVSHATSTPESKPRKIHEAKTYPIALH